MFKNHKEVVCKHPWESFSPESLHDHTVPVSTRVQKMWEKCLQTLVLQETDDKFSVALLFLVITKSDKQGFN